VPTNPELVRLCKLWDRLTEELNKMGLYEDVDYNALFCQMEGDKAELSVGGGLRHRAHVHYGERKLEYYDERRGVDEAVKKLMEGRAKARCEIMKEEIGKWEFVFGVKCEDVKDFEEAFKVLAFATSMHARIDDPSRWYGKDFEKLDGECRIDDPIEREVCAVNRLLKKLEGRLKS